MWLQPDLPIGVRSAASFIMLFMSVGMNHLSWSQSSAGIKPSYLYNFELGWSDESETTWHIPFEFPDRSSVLLTYSFAIQDSLPDTVFIYFEGVAWDAELELNGKYLDVHGVSFTPWVIPVPGDSLRASQNELRLRLTRGERKAFYPRQFLGIFRPVYLLNSSQLEAMQQAFMPEVPHADSVAVIAPYFRSHGYSFQGYEASRILLPLYQNKIKYVYFAFPPDRYFQLYCASLGFVAVRELRQEDYVGLVNPYPYEPAGFPYTPDFWLDEEAGRTIYYGDVRLADQFRLPADPGDHSSLLILIILFPLLSLFIIKLISPGFFNNQLGFLFKPQLFLEPSVETSYSNQGLLYILQLFKFINGAIFLTLVYYYIHKENQWDSMNIFTDWSLINQIFYQTNSLIAMLGKSLLLLLGWGMAKQLFMGLVGRSFGIKGMLPAFMGLEVVSSYPLILVMGIPMALILYMERLWGGLVGGLLIVLLTIYLVRRIYILFIGLDRLFTFSYTVKILYICTFNVLPYIIMF